MFVQITYFSEPTATINVMRKPKDDSGIRNQKRRIVHTDIPMPETTSSEANGLGSAASVTHGGGAPIVLNIPKRLDSPNRWQGRHWRVKHKLSQAWEELIWIEAHHFRGSLNRWIQRRVRVTVERRVPSIRNFIRDDDNLRFAVKPLLDALKRGGYIYDDSRYWLDHPAPTQSISADGKDWTVVTIQGL